MDAPLLKNSVLLSRDHRGASAVRAETWTGPPPSVDTTKT
jgi:hypothetical protein